MKRLLVLVAVAFSAVALYAVTTAPAGQQAVTPAQFAALTKRVTTLEKNLKTTRGALGTLISCTYAKAIPVSEYDGFVYQPSSGSQVTTTALSLTDTGDTAQYWVLTTSQACATDINSKLAPFGRLVQGHFGRLQH